MASYQGPATVLSQQGHLLAQLRSDIWWNVAGADAPWGGVLYAPSGQLDAWTQWDEQLVLRLPDGQTGSFLVARQRQRPRSSMASVVGCRPFGDPAGLLPVTVRPEAIG